MNLDRFLHYKPRDLLKSKYPLCYLLDLIDHSFHDAFDFLLCGYFEVLRNNCDIDFDSGFENEGGEFIGEVVLFEEGVGHK